MSFKKLLLLCFYMSFNAAINADTDKKPNRCTLSQSPGRCRGYFPRFWYNEATKSCEPFIYGGCQGNENNFMTKEACEEACF